MSQINNPNQNEAAPQPPTMFRNFYRCPQCCIEWDDIWDCMCDDECPVCRADYSPYDSEEITEDTDATQSAFDFKSETPSRRLIDFVKANDRKGAIDYLRNLTQETFSDEALRAGFSMRRFKDGLPALFEDLMNQFQRVRRAIYERDIVDIIIDALCVSNGDAQGLIETRDAMIEVEFISGNSSATAAQHILEDIARACESHSKHEELPQS